MGAAVSGDFDTTVRWKELRGPLRMRVSDSKTINIVEQRG